MVLQVGDVVRKLHTSLTGVPKTQNHAPRLGHNDICENLIPTRYGKHEKSEYFI